MSFQIGVRRAQNFRENDFTKNYFIIKIGKNYCTFLDSKLPIVYCAHPIQMEELYIKKSAVSD